MALVHLERAHLGLAGIVGDRAFATNSGRKANA
jgi:hypothetical protein